MDQPENKQKAIPIMLADDHLIVREGLVAVPSEEPDFELVGFAENGGQACLAIPARLNLCRDHLQSRAY